MIKLSPNSGSVQTLPLDAHLVYRFEDQTERHGESTRPALHARTSSGGESRPGGGAGARIPWGSERSWVTRSTPLPRTLQRRVLRDSGPQATAERRRKM